MLDALLGDRLLSRGLEITFLLIMVYLVVANAKGFSEVVRSIGTVYSESVRALQAR